MRYATLFGLCGRAGHGRRRSAALAAQGVWVRGRPGAAFSGQHAVHRPDRLFAGAAIFNCGAVRPGRHRRGLDPGYDLFCSFCALCAGRAGAAESCLSYGERWETTIKLASQWFLWYNAIHAEGVTIATWSAAL